MRKDGAKQVRAGAVSTRSKSAGSSKVMTVLRGRRLPASAALAMRRPRAKKSGSKVALIMAFFIDKFSATVNRPQVNKITLNIVHY